MTELALAEASPGGPLLEVDDLRVDFPTEDGVVHAVRGLSYAVKAGQVLAIVGESGAGKSVANLALLGLLPRNARVSGSARFRGVELLSLRPKQLNQVRGKRLSMIFQDPMTSLNPVYTIGWQLSEALLAHGTMSKREAWDRATELLGIVGIPRPGERVGGYPHEFSGGMRQRVVIALAIANDPDVIIADEPTTALDVTIQAQVLETLEKAQEETNAAIVLITHDLGVVAGMADEVLVMYAGRGVEVGSVDDIFERPRMPYTLGLLGSLPRLDVEGVERLTPITGAPPSPINLPAGCPFAPRCPLARSACRDAEPSLLAVNSSPHRAACFFHDELAAQPDAAAVFDVTASDELAAERPEP